MSATTPTLWTDHLCDPAQPDLIRLDSPAWWAWLEAPTTTRFSVPVVDVVQGCIAAVLTVRKERRQRGGVYWVAYRRQQGQLHKVYLGRTPTLTKARLAALVRSWPVPPATPPRKEAPAGATPAPLRDRV